MASHSNVPAHSSHYDRRPTTLKTPENFREKLPRENRKNTFRDRGISQKHWFPHIQSDPDVITIAAREPLPQRNARYDSLREIIHHQMQFLRRRCVLKSRTGGAKMPPLRETPTFAVRFRRIVVTIPQIDAVFEETERLRSIAGYVAEANVAVGCISHPTPKYQKTTIETVSELSRML